MAQRPRYGSSRRHGSYPVSEVCYGGIDFSGAREPLANLWTAVGRDGDGRLEVTSLRPHAFRADLVGFVGDGWRRAVDAGDECSALWGVNFACGLPSAVVRHLVGADGGWDDLLAWVADRPADEVRDSVPAELRTPRQTDMGGPTAPFDTRNYRQTAEGLRWLHTLREEHDACVAPRTADEGACCLVEVSPQATTIDLGLPRRRAPSRPGEIRARAAALRTFVTFRTAETEALAVTLEDAWDAVLCALTAWLVRDDLEQPFRTGSRDRETLDLEGWIYRPPAALG